MKKRLNKISMDHEKGTSTPHFIIFVALAGFAAYVVYTLFIR